MRYSRADDGFTRVATLDIETTHYKPTEGETVSIGIGVHDRGTDSNEATYSLHHRDGTGEHTLVQRAFDELDGYDADVLVSYKGRDFDLSFLQDRLTILGKTVNTPALDTRETHVDLFEDRQAEANRQNQKWPSLEECVSAYGWTNAETIWDGREVTNVRFGEELGPTYLEALTDGDDDRVGALTDVVEHYLVTDLEANLAIYYGDIEEEFEPAYLGSKKMFDA